MKIWITNQCNNYESIRWWLFELEWRKDEEKLFEKKKKVRSINNQNLIGDKKSKNSQSSTIARNRWCDRFDDHHYNPNGFLLFLSFSTLRKKNSVENPQNSLLIHSEKIFFKKERRKKKSNEEEYQFEVLVLVVTNILQHSIQRWRENERREWYLSLSLFVLSLLDSFHYSW